MRIETFKPSRLWIGAIAVLFVSIGLEFYGRACGFLLTSDSLQYLSASQSFSQHGTFLSPDGSYYSYWPPLFPLILSLFKQPQLALIWINLVCKIILAVVLLRIADSFIKDFLLKISFLIASLIGVHVAMISVFIWSELIFMTLIFLNAYCAINVKKHRSYFYWMLVSGFLACFQRNAGLFWMGGVCLWLLLDTSLPLKVRAWHSVVCFLVCTSGMWAWNSYNTFFIPADFSFYQHDFFTYTVPNLKSTLSTFGKMIVPLNGTGGMLFGILFLMSVLVVLNIKTDRNIQLLVFVLTSYSLGFLIMPGHLDSFEMDRYFSVITPFAYLFIMVMIETKIQPATSTIRACAYAIVFIWLCYPLTRTLKNVQAWHQRSCSVDNAK